MLKRLIKQNFLLRGIDFGFRQFPEIPAGASVTRFVVMHPELIFRDDFPYSG
jgi:hypothetical protein